MKKLMTTACLAAALWVGYACTHSSELTPDAADATARTGTVQSGSATGPHNGTAMGPHSGTMVHPHSGTATGPFSGTEDHPNSGTAMHPHSGTATPPPSGTAGPGHHPPGPGPKHG